MGMATTTTTIGTQTVPAPAHTDATASEAYALAASTWPPLSSSRNEGMQWYERIMRNAQPASGDAARFVAGM